MIPDDKLGSVIERIIVRLEKRANLGVFHEFTSFADAT
jgi:hypothetical protein